jgi:hypothetical protein
MSGEPILPTAREIIGPAKDAIVAERSTASTHVELDHNYAKVLGGWRGQFGVANARLGAEVAAARSPTSTGRALTELCAGRFDTPRLEDPTKAIGELVLTREVVHVRAWPLITAADATTEVTATALLNAIASAMNGALGHPRSVYDANTGLGSHATTDTTAAFTASPFANMGDLVTAANSAKQQANRHFSNTRMSDGAALAAHLDVDDTSTITVADAAASAFGSAFSANTRASQQSLLLVINATKRALNAHFVVEARGGSIRKGTKISVAAAPSAIPPLDASTHETTQDVFVPAGDQSVTMQTQATLTGPASNLPAVVGRTPVIVLQGELFDAGAALAFAPTALRAAGGTLGQSDELLRAASRASWTGDAAPTDTALLAGSLRSSGVAYFGQFDDTTAGRAYVYVADETWAQSDAWLATVEQQLREDWLGLGCRIGMGAVENLVVRARLTVVVRDAKFLVDTAPITAKLQTTLRAYFDTRPDWWLWNLQAIRAICSVVDRVRVLQVTEAIILDTDDVPIAEPATPIAGNTVTHWRLEDSALDVTYVGPS